MRGIALVCVRADRSGRYPDTGVGVGGGGLRVRSTTTTSDDTRHGDAAYRRGVGVSPSLSRCFPPRPTPLLTLISPFREIRGTSLPPPPLSHSLSVFLDAVCPASPRSSSAKFSFSLYLISIREIGLRQLLSLSLFARDYTRRESGCSHGCALSVLSARARW